MGDTKTIRPFALKGHGSIAHSASPLSCVASVSVVQRAKKERDFRCKWGESRNKKEGVGEGEGKEGNACSQAL